MSTRKSPPRIKVAGIAQYSLQLPKALHDAMRTLRLARYRQEGLDPKLCRLYIEAVDQYVKAKPQQQLLAKSMRTARASRNESAAISAAS